MHTGFRPISFLFVIKEGITLKQTPLYHHWLKQMSEQGKVYKLYTNKNNEIRRFKDGKNNAIMLAGGPKLIEGQLLPNSNYIILQIAYIQGNYYIALKENNHEEDNNAANT